MHQTIRIFIGTEEKTEIARRVLECSIVRHTDSNVEFTPMIGPRWEYSQAGIKVGTGFSLRRWMIPAACEWQGKAIYMDADQLVLGDVAQLWDYADPLTTKVKASAWLTYQPDKFRATPWPQTSVMLIDCDAAKTQWGWRIEQVLKYLRENPTKEMYANFMHATWMEPQPGKIPIGWNHLNAFVSGATKLIHYTKEPEQPWYVPDHPLAIYWKKELAIAIEMGYVTPDMLKEALAKWEVKDDWRTTNGLHPEYEKFIPKKKPRGLTEAQPTRKLPAYEIGKPRPVYSKTDGRKDRSVVWMTTCGMDMWEASGLELVNSFINKKIIGELRIGLEGFTDDEVDDLPIHPYVHYEHLNVETNVLLTAVRDRFGDSIPISLGGKAKEPLCGCVQGGLDVHSKKHKLPCIGYWFCKNFFRWLRKVAMQQQVLESCDGADTLIWLDSDCVFTNFVDSRVINSWFEGPHALFYLKNKRPIAETGVIGFDLSLNGGSVIDAVVKYYLSGDFLKLSRWDDSAAYQWCIDRATCKVRDIARAVGENSQVVPHSPLGAYLSHAKGRHGRGLKIMT